jgi:hypothetical protein
VRLIMTMVKDRKIFLCRLSIPPRWVAFVIVESVSGDVACPKIDFSSMRSLLTDGLHLTAARFSTLR